MQINSYFILFLIKCEPYASPKLCYYGAVRWTSIYFVEFMPMEQNPVALTSLAKCAGWAAKFSPEDLAQVLRQLPVFTGPDLLVGNGTGDDAAVYKISDETALVLTVDFFPPMVDDPWHFGAIAAANSSVIVTHSIYLSLCWYMY